MVWTIEFTGPARREFAKLDRQGANRILEFINENLAKAENPRQWGKPLKGKLDNYWSYRIGDFRLLCTIEDGRMVVIVVRIGNRREVYRKR